MATPIPPPPKETPPTDYFNLPCPIPYDEISREAFMSLKPELFKGLRVDFTKGLNEKFSLSHSATMGLMEVPSQSSETIKIPTAQYEFGANFLDPKLMLVGRYNDGRVTARLKGDITDNLSLKANAQLTSEPHMSHGMASFDYQGKDYRSQFQLGSGALFGANYIQSVTRNLSVGGEVFWAGQHRKSGIGYAARYNTDNMVATGQVASTGTVAMSYVQKVSDKVSLGTDFMYNYLSREATASLGYDYILRQCRLRGKVDSNGGVTAAFLEERVNMGVNFILSAEIDHWKKDYKFGMGQDQDNIISFASELNHHHRLPSSKPVLADVIYLQISFRKYSCRIAFQIMQIEALATTVIVVVDSLYLGVLYISFDYQCCKKIFNFSSISFFSHFIGLNFDKKMLKIEK